MSDDLTAALGPAVTDLTAEQTNRVAAAAEAIADRYPDPDDQHLRDAALSAVVQHLLGESTPDEASRTLVAARLAEQRAYAAALSLAVQLVRDGEPKATAARRCGIDRMSLLKALGER